MVKRTSRHATITDVAALAGVSKKTVSRVFNSEPNVRAATRDRVLDVAQRLNYSPNVSARRLAKRRSFILALAYEDRDANHYIPDVQHGVLDVCRRRGYDLLLHPCGKDVSKVPQEIAKLGQQALIDGLILMSPLADSREMLLDLGLTGVPITRLSQVFRDQYSPCISVNDEEAAQEMTAHLAGLGHRHIGFVLGHPDHGSAADRLRGFKGALTSLGLRIRDAWMYQGDYTYASGVAAGNALLTGDTRPTAIFASNDDMAAGVLTAAHRLGIDVPGQLSVAGFDDIPMTERLWPPLTTVRQPVKEAAATATEVLLSLLDNEPDVPQSTELKATLIVRESTGPVPDAPAA